MQGKKIDDINEGDFFCKFLHKRLIQNNQNVLGVNLGATGSGKSYRDLRLAEIWYKYHFNKPFPVKNICFGVAYTMRLLNEALREGTLEKGEILIFEEAGVNMGNLDFQNKVSKMFNYILQSFRSMNIAILFNLPYISMLNKSARMLLHYSFESLSIDRVNKINYCKPYIHQVNQRSGKIYIKIPRIIRGKKLIKLGVLGLGMPSPELVRAYETKKQKFLADTTLEFSQKLDNIEREEQKKMARNDLTEVEQLHFDLIEEGKTPKEIAKMRSKTLASTYQALKRIKEKGYKPHIPQIA